MAAGFRKKFRDLKNNAEVQEYYKKGSAILGKLDYTDHSVDHAEIVARQAANILTQFGYPEEDIELAKTPITCTISEMPSTEAIMRSMERCGQ